MSAPSGLRFGAFELDPSTGELRQRGDLVKLAGQPLKVLWLLVRRAGAIPNLHGPQFLGLAAPAETRTAAARLT